MIRSFATLFAVLSLFTAFASAAEPGRPATVKVAAVQCPSDLGDIPGNTRRLTTLIETAAREGAKIVVLPEAAVTGYLSQDLKTNWHVPGKPIETYYTFEKGSRGFRTNGSRPGDR